MQHLDVLERNAQFVGDQLAPSRLVALAVRRGTADDFDLPGGQHPDAGVLPAASRCTQCPKHAGRGQPAYLGVGRDTDAQLHRVVCVPAPPLLGAQTVIVE